MKDENCLWDLSSYQGGEGYATCQEEMKAGRQPFMSPEVAERQLRQGVADGSIHFSYVSDMDGVINMYREGFVRAFETYNFGVRGVNANTLFYQSLGWGAAEVPTLVEAIKYADRHCDEKADLTLWFNNNKFDEEDKAKLEGATDGSKLLIKACDI